MRDYFSPNGDNLTYSPDSNDASVAVTKTERTGSSVIIITPKGVGSTSVVVELMNFRGLRVTQSFTVTVGQEAQQNQRPVVVTPTPPSQRFERGDAIIVQNTSPSALNIRGGPGVGWGEKGQASDGATGIIIDGPQQAKKGYTWWKVKWDSSNKVQWTHQTANNVGWSVEAMDGTEYLVSRPSAPVSLSFDLAIQPLTVNKRNLPPGEFFMLHVTVRNNGPDRSGASDLSYYHSSILGRSPTDPPQLQGTVSLDPIAPGRSTTKSIRLLAPSVPRTYYYGAWLAANIGDTDIYNDVATEVGVTVTATTVQNPNLPDTDLPDVNTPSVDLPSAVYCHRKFRPLSNIRLCYNDNPFERRIPMAKRRRFTAKFKAEVVLEALHGESSQAELCRRHNLSENQVSTWKRQLLENVETFFESADKQSSESAERIVELEQLVGRLTLALEIQKKASTLLD